MLAAVEDEEGFIGFARYLGDQRLAFEHRGTVKDPMLLIGSEGWENGTIGRYLDAVAARGESGAGNAFDEASKAYNPRRRAVRTLLYGKYCE